MKIDWEKIKGFSEHENWGEPDKMDPELIEALLELRKYVNKSIVIHCGTQGVHTAGSIHAEGKAADLHIVGMHYIDAFLAASRFPAFRGIGIYPHWNNKGLHLDTRPVKMRAMWWRDAKGIYQNVDAAAIRSWK